MSGFFDADPDELLRQNSTSTDERDRQKAQNLDEVMRQIILQDFEVMKKFGRKSNSGITFPQSIEPLWKN